MKTRFTRTQRSLYSFLSWIALSHTVLARDMTAFDLIKEGNRYIDEQSKDKVVQIRSERSSGSLIPDIWYVVYHDPDAVLKIVEVKFAAGHKMGVKRPMLLLEPISQMDQPLPREKLGINSDKAIAIATQEPLLEKVTLRSSRLILQRRSVDDDRPVWKVRLWAAKLKNPNENADIGVVIISAEDGKVLKSDLNLEHLE
jgi:hypothetical protein